MEATIYDSNGLPKILAGSVYGSLSAGTTNMVMGGVVFSNSNNVSFGLNGSTVTASASYAQGSLSAGTASMVLGQVVFSNSNGVGFGLNGSTVTASYTQSTGMRAIYDGANSVTSGTLSLANANNVSFSINGQTLSASAHPRGGLSAGTASVILGDVVFSNSNGVSFGLNGSTVTASVAGGAGGTVSAGTTNVALGEVVFSDSNRFSWGLNGSTVTLSYIPYLRAIADSAATVVDNTLHFSNSNGITFGISDYTITAQFSNSNIRGIQAGINIINTGTANFSNSNNVSFGINGNTVTASASFAQTGVTHSGFFPYGDAFAQMSFQLGQGSVVLAPVQFPDAIYDRVGLYLFNSNATNSSGSHTLSLHYGLYTRNASTLSLLYSASATTALTHSGTAGSYSLYSGLRLFTIGDTRTVTQGDYWIGVLSRTTSGGANGSYSNAVLQKVNSSYAGGFGLASNISYQIELGRGCFSATTAAMPTSIAFSAIDGNDPQTFRSPIVNFANGTV